MTTRAATLTATLHTRDDGTLELRAPSVGLLRDGASVGRIVHAGDVVGQLEILGTVHVVLAAAGAEGAVVEDAAALLQMHARSKTPLAYDDAFVVLDPKAASSQSHAGKAAASKSASTTGLVLKAPSSGRYYGRPGPGKDAFVKVGDVLTQGQTVALLEVMKTFNRVLYGGASLPERARVTAIVPAEESDVQSGSVLLELEPA